MNEGGLKRLKSNSNKGVYYATKTIKRQYQLYLMLLLPVAFIVLFHYVPMYGAQIAFRRFTITEGIWGSEWVGFTYFERFLTSPHFATALLNTVRLSLYTLLFSFPLPIIMALSLNAVRNMKFKKAMQTSYYMPYFISLVVVIGIMKQITSPKLGVINKLIMALGGEAVNFMGIPGWFPALYVISDIWQTAGYTSVIFLAALTAVDPELYCAASVDGASRLQQMWHIEAPAVIPTACLMLIIRTGKLIKVGFEKVYLMQNSLNLSTSEVLSTYVYKVGIASTSSLPNYSYGTAVGLFNAVVSLLLVVLVNELIKRLGGENLW